MHEGAQADGGRSPWRELVSRGRDGSRATWRVNLSSVSVSTGTRIGVRARGTATSSCARLSRPRAWPTSVRPPVLEGRNWLRSRGRQRALDGKVGVPILPLAPPPPLVPPLRARLLDARAGPAGAPPRFGTARQPRGETPTCQLSASPHWNWEHREVASGTRLTHLY